MSNHLPGSIFDKIINLYKEAVKRLPAIKYSWGLVAIICILALINFFKLGDAEVVFRSSLLALGIIFLIFIFSFLTRTNDKAIRYAMYILTYVIILTTAALVIGFALHTLTPIKIPFYDKILAAHSDTAVTDTTKNINRQDTASINNYNNEIKPDSNKKVTPVNSLKSKQDPVRSTENNSTIDNGKKPPTPVPPELCPVKCITKGIAGVEVSFEDPATHKLYKFVSGKDQYLQFKVPCDLAEKTVDITFCKDGKFDYRNQKISEMQIPD
jgi:hypothetical protein